MFDQRKMYWQCRILVKSYLILTWTESLDTAYIIQTLLSWYHFIRFYKIVSPVNQIFRWSNRWVMYLPLAVSYFADLKKMPGLVEHSSGCRVLLVPETALQVRSFRGFLCTYLFWNLLNQCKNFSGTIYFVKSILRWVSFTYFFYSAQLVWEFSVWFFALNFGN